MKKILCYFFVITLILQVYTGMGNQTVKAEEQVESTLIENEDTIIYNFNHKTKNPYICIANKAQHLWVGETFRFTIVANLLPEASISWRVSDTEIAEINQVTGDFMPKSAGTVKVYATDTMSGKGSVCTVQVIDESKMIFTEIPREWYDVKVLDEEGAKVYGNTSEECVKLTFKEEYGDAFRKGSMLAFPDEVDGKKVVWLDINFIYYTGDLEGVKYPKYATILFEQGQYANKNKYIIFPDHLKFLFTAGGINTELVHLPDVQTLDYSAIEHCANSKELVIPEGVDEISSLNGTWRYIFWEQNAKSIGIHVDGNNKNYYSIYGVLFRQSVEPFEYRADLLDYKWTGRPTTIMRYPSGSIAQSYIVPNDVEQIGSYTFLGAVKLKKITLPNSIIEIDNGAFKKCSNLEKIEFPDGLRRIGEEAFAGCKQLTKVVIPDGVTELGGFCFANCPNLETIVIPKSVTSIGKALVGKTYKKNITIITPKGSFAEQYAKKSGIPYKNR